MREDCKRGMGGGGRSEDCWRWMDGGRIAGGGWEDCRVGGWKEWEMLKRDGWRD